jgi:hypothetical protein
MMIKERREPRQNLACQRSPQQANGLQQSIAFCSNGAVTFGDRWTSHDPGGANALFLSAGQFGRATASADTPAAN